MGTFKIQYVSMLKKTQKKRQLDSIMAALINMFLSRACQSETLVVCDVDEDLVKRLKEFRLRKQTNNAAIISKCSHFRATLYFLP